MSQGGFKHNRKSIRLKGYNYSWPGFYFVTICTKNQFCCLGDVVAGQDKFAPGEIRLSKLGRVVRDIWLSIPKHNNLAELDEYIIMPNHMHGIIIIRNVGEIHEFPLHLRWDMKARRQMVLPKIIGKFKMNSAEKINKIINRSGSFWQRNYYEHIIRNEESLNRIQRYIKFNPIKWFKDIENPKNYFF